MKTAAYKRSTGGETVQRSAERQAVKMPAFPTGNLFEKVLYQLFPIRGKAFSLRKLPQRHTVPIARLDISSQTLYALKTV
jgi:hypothetical protein